jgi:hypothetical protein
VSLQWIGKALVYLMLEMGALAGVPMRPEEIEKLMRVFDKTTITAVQEKGEPK